MNMIDYETRKSEASSYYQLALIKVAETQTPDGQKFAKEQRVKIADDLGRSMTHFKSGVEAVVEYTYAHAFGGDDIKSYSLRFDDGSTSAWYYESQLTAVDIQIIKEQTV